MVEHDAAHQRVRARHAIRTHESRLAAKWHAEWRQRFSAGQAVQAAVCRIQYRRMPAAGSHGSGQVTDDVCDATDLGTGQCAVLRGDENDFGFANRTVLPTSG